MGKTEITDRPQSTDDVPTRTGKVINFLSDTVTKPTLEMAQAITDVILNGRVGDDEYGLDEVVQELEEKAAKATGMEAAILVPSGLMANQIAILVHAERTSEKILEKCRRATNPNYRNPIERGGVVMLGHNSHIATWEVGAPSILAGVIFRTVKKGDNIILGEDVRASYRAPSIWYPTTKLLCLENSLINGKVVPLPTMESACTAAMEYGIPVHLDGARVFNAATRMLELEEDDDGNVRGLRDFGKELLYRKVREITSSLKKTGGSMMFCLSKGLASPVGSVLCGGEDFISKARSYRKLLGGGMRQAGVLAACGILSIDKMALRLWEDHANARYLAELLNDHVLTSENKININEIETNMVFCNISMKNPRNEEHFVATLKDTKGIKINGRDVNNTNKNGDGLFRFVTHNDVSREDIEYAVQVISDFVKKG